MKKFDFFFLFPSTKNNNNNKKQLNFCFHIHPFFLLTIKFKKKKNKILSLHVVNFQDYQNAHNSMMINHKTIHCCINENTKKKKIERKRFNNTDLTTKYICKTETSKKKMATMK